jgi:hypothetical protein
MKKIISTITAIIITLGAYAQSESSVTASPDTTKRQQSSVAHPDGYMLLSGIMMTVKDQKMTILKRDTSLVNGTLIMANGNYIKKGGTKLMFKEGEHMDLNGNLIQMTSMNRPIKKPKDKMYLPIDTVKNKKKG